MSRFINADDAKAIICKYENRMSRQHNMIYEIEKITAADVQEVVRCKDCVDCREAHYENEGEKPYIKRICKLFGKQIHEYDFCSYGERLGRP